MLSLFAQKHQRVLEIARTQLDDLERFLEAIGRVTGVAYDGV